MIKTGTKLTYKIDDIDIAKKLTNGLIHILIPKNNWVNSLECFIIKTTRIKHYVNNMLLNSYQISNSERYMDSLNRLYIRPIMAEIFIPITNSKDEYLDAVKLMKYTFEMHFEIEIDKIENLVISENKLDEHEISLEFICDDGVISIDKFLTREKLFDPDDDRFLLDMFANAGQILYDIYKPKHVFVI